MNIDNNVELTPILDEDIDIDFPVTAQAVDRDTSSWIADAQYAGFDNEEGAW